jgi:hypothetical protein
VCNSCPFNPVTIDCSIACSSSAASCSFNDGDPSYCYNTCASTSVPYTTTGWTNITFGCLMKPSVVDCTSFFDCYESLCH